MGEGSEESGAEAPVKKRQKGGKLLCSLSARGGREERKTQWQRNRWGELRGASGARTRASRGETPRSDDSGGGGRERVLKINCFNCMLPRVAFQGEMVVYKFNK